MADPIIPLNVGGQLFQTRKSTLLRSPYFKSMFLGGFAENTENAESLEDEVKETIENNKTPQFLDFDPDLFRHVLNRLRNPEYMFPDDIFGLRQVSEHFGLEWNSPKQQAARIIPWAHNNDQKTVNIWEDIRELPDNPGQFYILQTKLKTYKYFVFMHLKFNYDPNCLFQIFIQRQKNKLRYTLTVRVMLSNEYHLVYVQNEQKKMISGNITPEPAIFNFISLKDVKQWINDNVLILEKS